MRTLRWSYFGLFFLGSLVSSSGAWSQETGASEARPIEWREVAPGVQTAEYKLGSNDVVFSKPVVLVRIDPKIVRFQVVQQLTDGGASLRAMTRSISGVVGINANFFDEAHQPLGLVFSEGQQLHGLQRGGSVLTGIFLIRKGVPNIIHRDAWDPKDVQLAVQAGPRLLSDGRLIPVRAGQDTSRRSGVAITNDGKVLLFATVLRFPGASFEDITRMLMDPELNVRDALNFDGGGSSQLFVETTPKLPQEIFVHGGDSVPVGLIVKLK